MEAGGNGKGSMTPNRAKGEQGTERLAQGLHKRAPSRHSTTPQTALNFPSAQRSAQPKLLMGAAI